MRAFLFFTAALLLANFAQAANALPESEFYLRLRLEAKLPRTSARFLGHDFFLCNRANECLPLFRAESNLAQADAHGRFRQVEYFSFNRIQAAAEKLGAAAPAALPALAEFYVRVDSQISGPRKNSGSGTFPHLYEAGSSSPLRRQISNSAADWRMKLPLASDTGEIKLHAELSILQVDSHDITAEFQSTPAPNQSDLFARLKNYQVVFVTGSDGYKAKYFGSEYYDSFQKWLTANGIENSRVIPGANRPIGEQAMAFAQLFNRLTSSKPVILVNYSIANTNFLEYLLNYGQNLKASGLLAGWIAVNASFVGNPLMEDVYNSPWKRMVAETIQSAEGLADIRYLNRDAYLDANYDKIKAAVKSIPAVITISSRINNTEFSSSRQKRFLELDQRGLDNDGSTGTFSHFIPGSDSISFDGTDHELLDKGTNGFGADPYAIYLKLFQRVMDRAEGQDRAH